jgi:hypothetical protein
MKIEPFCKLFCENRNQQVSNVFDIHPTLIITSCVSNLNGECDLTLDIYFFKNLSNILERTNLDQTLSQKN